MAAKMMHYRLLAREPGIRHGVTLRDPEAPLDFSLALHTGQAREAIRANRAMLEEYFGPESRFVSVLQVHGEEIYRVEEPRHLGWEDLEQVPRADALMTDRPGAVLTILTADCVPILLYDPVRRAVAAVHAGWKGSARRILAKTVRAMEEAYGSDPADLLAAIGPAIGGCCYEVGEEVAEPFAEIPGAVRRIPGANPHLDLKEVNLRQLLDAGVKRERIESSPVCTACEHERFFSYRREGGCDGRFMSCIMIEEEGKEQKKLKAEGR